MQNNCNFYILSDARENGRFLYACFLIEQAIGINSEDETAERNNKPIYVHCQNEQEACQFDDLLWSYKETSFIPHSLVTADFSIEDAPVQIGFSEPPKDFTDTLICLSIMPTLQDFCAQFSTIIEIVDQKSEVKEALRLRYQHYRTLGYNLNNLKV